MNRKQKGTSRMILQYLQSNPDAGDTLEGIAKWWLEFQMIESSVSEVADVLEGLIRRGTIRMHTVSDGTTFYKVNTET